MLGPDPVGLGAAGELGLLRRRIRCRRMVAIAVVGHGHFVVEPAPPVLLEEDGVLVLLSVADPETEPDMLPEVLGVVEELEELGDVSVLVVVDGVVVVELGVELVPELL